MDSTTELESRKICRICLTQDDDAEFSDIFDSPNLPMEILSIGSVEVFQSDGMPRKVCVVCKTILGNAYKFKQICKRSDTLLKMYPMTGKVPPKIQIPQEMVPPRKTEDKLEVPTKPESKTVAVGHDAVETHEEFTQTDPVIEDLPLVFEEDLDSLPIISPPPQFSLIEQVKILNKSQATSSAPKQFKRPARIKIEKVELGKPRILNSQVASNPKFDDIIETTDTSDGGIQIITYNEEYLEDGVEWDAKKKDEELLYSVEEVEDWGSKHEKKDKSDDGVVYSCDMCDRSFPLLQQLEIHRKNHTRERNHPCDSCDKSFFTKYDLAKHVVTHTKQKDYTCIVCKKSFSRSTLLYRHEKIHTDPKIPRHKCTECERVYLNRNDLDKHLTNHMKNRPFGCNYCDKRFAFKQGLERHEVIHDTTNQPHPCLYCELKFPSTARLQRHLSSEHAGTRPFPCSRCTKRFMLSHHLYRHMRTAHSPLDASFQCPECEEMIGNRDDFFVHCSDHGIQSLRCPLCKFNFESSDEVVDHIQLHSESDLFFCDYCNLIYMNQEDLNQHFTDEHSNELCSVDEEIQLIVEEPPSRLPVKCQRAESKAINYQEIEQEEVEEYEVEHEEQTTSDQEGASFVEYEEVETNYEPKAKVTKTEAPTKNLHNALKEAARKTYKKESPPEKKQPTPKKLPTRSQPAQVKVERVKMTAAKIAQLKKEGKIKIVNGEMVMKT